MTTTRDSRTALGRRTLAAERAATTAVDVATREVDRRLDLERRVADLEHVQLAHVTLQHELEQALGRRARRRLARIRQERAQ